jgi:hypothetical protein
MSTPSNAPAAAINAATPLLLLPVHVQTRFVDKADGSSALLVRIYPDQIAIHSHEPELTAQESADGQAYWNSVWRAGNPPPNPDDAKAPWRNLAARYGPQRAAWIARQLTPTNVAKQPVTPTAAGVAPVPAPVFPAVPTRASSWEKPAFADALPDAWTVVLVSGGATTVQRGGPIAKSLNVSLTPNGNGFPAGGAVDAGLQWMTDFPTAVAAGMALSIPLTADQRAAGFDQLFVYGLRASDPKPAQTLAGLFDAQHYTDGLSFLPQGAPTNNTPDATSIFSRKDPDFEISFQTERQKPLTANAACDGVAFASMTGVPTATFDHVSYADQMAAVNSADMLCALWPSTIGYFFGQMMAPMLTPSQIEDTRNYALANVRPRGPLPAFRAGTMPYGVLPVTSVFQYAANAGAGNVEPALAALLRQLWPAWLSSSASAPQLQPDGDPDQSLMSVLGMDASSMMFRGRPVLGDAFLWNFLHFLGLPDTSQRQWFQHLSTPARSILDLFGFANSQPRLLGLAFADRSFPVRFPTVQDAPLSETDGLAQDADLGGGHKVNYIQWLQTASVADLQAENYPGSKPTSLLYKILRQSVLTLYATLAAAAEIKAGRLTLAQIQESEIIGADPAAKSLTPWQLLARPSVPNPQLNWADYLTKTAFGAGSVFAQLADLRASLGRLAALPSAELDRLLTETLDVCSHRLDAWATGIATALLNRTRAAQNHSIGLGCYGWVEEIRPESGRAAVQGRELDAVHKLDTLRAQFMTATPPVPLQPLSDNGGYIYAPSPAQAAVAAVLRNGFITHKNTGSEGLLSIDLSSERVNRALTLIRGVQQGQSLNALLGYLFEDALSDRGLQKYIQPFRDKHPVVGGKLTPGNAPSESLAASNVVDGLALRTAWDAGTYPIGGNWGPGLPPPGADQQGVTAVLQTLDEYADSLGDLSIAETVFQMVRGNPGRGSALMDAMSRGSRPADPQIVSTPSSGIDLTHRVVLLFAGPVTAAAAWSPIPRHPRAAAEPSLDAWLSLMLPDPAIVRCRVTFLDAQGNTHSTTVALRDLSIGPLDLLAMSDAAETPQRSEIESRILFAAHLPAGAQDAQIVFDTAGLPAGSLGFADVLFIAQTLRALIGSARPLNPQDMTTPETDATAAGGSVVLSDLRTRAAAAVHSLAVDLGSLKSAATPAAIRTALLACSYYGVSGAIPNTSTGADPDITQQKASVAAILDARLAEASKTNIPAASAADLQAVFQAIFGSDFLALPRFVPPHLADVHAAFSQSDSLVAGDSQATARWFRQATYTHSGVSRLDLALSTAQALGEPSAYPPKLALAQVPPPLSQPDRWLALPLDPSKLPQRGRVAIAAVATGRPDTAANFAGLMVDEWPERIPDASGTAAVAFHFNEPGARAPNALLLAVCPRQQATWDDAMLQAILGEALQLAKIRSVDLASVGTVGQILPALYFALNLQSAAISTRFTT